MTTPTERLTCRAAAVLDEEVAIAVRVSKGSPNPPTALFESLKRAVTNRFTDQGDLDGVLVFTRYGGRVLTNRSGFRSLDPTFPIRHLSRAVPIAVDLDLLTEELIPILRIGAETFMVNPLDFGALARAVVAGELAEPALAEQLTPWHEQMEAARTSQTNR